MQNMTFVQNFLAIFAFICFFFTLMISKFSSRFFNGKLLDQDFLKPQAFHSEPIPRSGGLSIFLLFLIFIFFYYSFFNIVLKDYLIISFALFSLGLLDDLKIKINPNIRLLLMTSVLILCINLFSIEIDKTGLSFLNIWLENKLFQNCFVLLCFLFVINGANLVDGFNGLLGIHFLIINLIFLSVINGSSFSVILISQILSVFIFTLFNFPKAKIFLGDGGSYLLGVLLSLNSIKIYQLSSQLSPFFLAIILFYIFYEVFFSFIRKMYLGVSPLKPDKLHLHMLLYNLIKKKFGLAKSNYLTSLIINFLYLILLIPAFYLKNDWLFCKMWFLFLIVIYSAFYFYLYKKNENI